MYVWACAIIIIAVIEPTTIQRRLALTSQSSITQTMENQKKDVHRTGLDKDIVEVDKSSPRYHRAQSLMKRMVTAQRAAMAIEAQALDLRQSGVDDSLSDLWDEMPLVAKQHEALLGDVPKELLRAEEPEFDDQGEVSPC